MSSQQIMIFNNVMTIAQDYQFHLRRNLKSMFDYYMTFDEDNQSVIFNWHVFLKDPWRKTARPEIRGSKYITGIQEGADCLEFIYEEYQKAYDTFFWYKSYKYMLHRDLLLLLDDNDNWNAKQQCFNMKVVVYLLMIPNISMRTENLTY